MTNPLDLIKGDHDKTRTMLDDYEDAELEEKQAIIMKMYEDLAVHMEMEEQDFYPEIEKISQEAKNLSAEARDDHDEIKTIIKNTDLNAGEDELDEHQAMLKEVLMSHMEKEEGEIFMLAESNLKDRFVSMAAKMMTFKATAKGQLLLSKFRLA